MREIAKAIRFHAKRLRKGTKIQSSPSFGATGTVDWFEQQIRNSKFYVEFGSGGSTFVAARAGVPFISVESDRRFLDKLMKGIEAEGKFDPARQEYRYADIGPTHRYGRPIVLFRPRNSRREKFKRYSDFPLRELNGKTPLLVLVDGRFRIACALKAFRALRGKDGWTLLVDDFLDREKYGVLTEFGTIREYVGRMAVFDGLKDFSPERLDAAIAQNELDYD